MIEFLLTFLIFIVVVAVMSIGVMRGRKPITGSCGGLANLGIAGACEICGGDPANCERDAPASRERSAAGSYYNAAD